MCYTVRMAFKTAVLRARVEPELLAALQSEAQRQDRELAQLVRSLLRQAMQEAGYLVPAADRV